MNNMESYDLKVLDAFLANQRRLFPENVASTREEAREFLEDCMAVVVKGKKAVWEYFEEEGVDILDMNEADILEAEEVFPVGDGRYLIVEC